MEAGHRPIYLDYHSTTPVDPAVLEAMMPYFSQFFGNPASRSHPYGWQASEAVEQSRLQVAQLIGVKKEDLFFTSGATEGLNFAIKGLAENLDYKGKHILTSATEHHAVLDTVDWLAKKGFEVEKLPVTSNGKLDVGRLDESIREDTIMVLVMLANNETGVLQDIKVIGDLCHAKKVAFICDAAQGVGKIPVNAIEMGIDVLVLSGHKMYAPKGIGAIYIAGNAKNLKPAALIHGGGHERGYRSGTLNVPGIVGLGAAAELYNSTRLKTDVHIAALRNQFESAILKNLENVIVNGCVECRLPTVSNLRLLHVDSQAVMTKLRTKVSLSSGSACSSADPSPSHVLLAMGLSPSEAKGSFRFSFGRQTTMDEVKLAGTWFMEAINEYRAESPVWMMFKQGMDVSDRAI